MNKIGRYTESDSMSSLICEDYAMLQLLNRFNIPLGFGDKTIGEVCMDNSIDSDTFLSIVNFLSKNYTFDADKVSVETLILYLSNSHKYFLEFKLPMIKQKLIEALDYGEENAISLVIVKYFDEYVSEVGKHMSYEEDTVYPYVEQLLDRRMDDKYRISVFLKQHDAIELKLSELKNIIIKYYPTKSSHKLNSVLFDIFSCAEELCQHNRIENEIFVPCILNMEKQLKTE